MNVYGVAPGRSHGVLTVPFRWSGHGQTPEAVQAARGQDVWSWEATGRARTGVEV